MALHGPLPATIMVTGRGSERVAVDALKQGAHDYIIKDGAESYVVLLPEVTSRARRQVLQREAAAAHAIERERLVAELTEALAKIKTLSGLIPICAWCKSIRNDKGFWESLESYLSQHSDALLGHGLCPGLRGPPLPVGQAASLSWAAPRLDTSRPARDSRRHESSGRAVVVPGAAALSLR